MSESSFYSVLYLVLYCIIVLWEDHFLWLNKISMVPPLSWVGSEPEPDLGWETKCLWWGDWTVGLTERLTEWHEDSYYQPWLVVVADLCLYLYWRLERFPRHHNTGSWPTWYFYPVITTHWHCDTIPTNIHNTTQRSQSGKNRTN